MNIRPKFEICQKCTHFKVNKTFDGICHFTHCTKIPRESTRGRAKPIIPIGYNNQMFEAAQIPDNCDFLLEYTLL